MKLRWKLAPASSTCKTCRHFYKTRRDRGRERQRQRSRESEVERDRGKKKHKQQETETRERRRQWDTDAERGIGRGIEAERDRGRERQWPRETEVRRNIGSETLNLKQKWLILKNVTLLCFVNNSLPPNNKLKMTIFTDKRHIYKSTFIYCTHWGSNLSPPTCVFVYPD